MAGMRNRQTLDQWIDEALIDGEKDGACTALSLVHHIGSKENEIHGIRFNNEKKWTAKELASLFQSKADSFAQDLTGGAQLFSLVAFYGDRDVPQARHPFQVIPEPDFAGLVSEGPTKDGVITQSMRHLEFQHREMYVMTRHLVDALAETNKEQREIIRDQNVELRGSYDALRRLMLGRLTEEHEFRLKESKVAQENKMWDKLLEYGPLVLDSITGGKLIPTAKKDSMLFDAIVRTVPREKLVDLVQSMPPELAAPLVARLEEVFKSAQLAEKNATDALARKDPEDDAGGD
jgi:hypothetical protein